MLELKEINKTYTTKSGYVTKALRNVSVSLPSRGLVFILGRSGSGKSTLLNVIGGIDAPDSGEMVIDGESNRNFTDNDYDSYRNTYVGFVFQEYNLIPEYSVGQNIALALELKGKRNNRSLVEDILRRVELTDGDGNTLYTRRVNELSGGQKQRVAIARALVKNPRLILADEPTGALDSKTGLQLYELLKKLSEDKLVVVVTHDRENAEKFGDRIIEIADGRIVSDVERTNCIPESPSEYKPVRSRLPFARILALGINTLKVKKFRLVTSVLLSVITLSIFGFAFIASLTDPLAVELRTLYDHDMRIISVITSRIDEEGVVETIASTAKQQDKIKEYNGGKNLINLVSASEVKKLGTVSDYIADKKDTEYYHRNHYYDIGLSDFTYLTELDPETGEIDSLITPDARFEDKSVCRLPITYNEIAITDIRASMFMRFGYMGEDGVRIDIDSPDDLIGRNLGKYTISGVYSTEQDRGFFEKYADREFTPNESNLYYALAFGAQNSVISFGFVLDGFSENLGIEKFNLNMIVMNGNIGKDYDFLSDLNYTADGYRYSVSITSAVTILTSFVVQFKEIFLQLFVIVALVFLLFTALLTMSFFNVIFDFKKREMGILRALGARSKDVLGICLVESTMIAIINFIVSIVLVGIACHIINTINSTLLFTISVPAFFAMLGVCLGVAVLSTIIPVWRTTHKKPVDIINGK